MKIIIKRSSAILLTAILLISAVACGNPSNEADPSNAATSTLSQSEAAATDKSVDPLAMYSPQITVTTAKYLGTGYQFRPNESAEKNMWLDLYKSELGINMDVVWSVSGDNAGGDQAEQKMNVVIASGDIPDILQVNPIQFKQLSDSDMIEDLTPYYEQYTTPVTKDILTHDGGDSLASAKIEGRLMGLPSMASNYDAASIIWVRTDWLQKLNLPEPKTMADVLKISEAFTKNDPDGNNKNDTFGLGLAKDLYGGEYSIMGFFEGYHAYLNHWYEDSSGQLLYGSIQPQVKEGLKALQTMFKDGQIDPEFGAKDATKVNESVVSDKIGMFYGQHWNCYLPLQTNHDKSNAQWQAFPIVSADDKTAQPMTGLAAEYYFVEKKGIKNPEVLMKLASLFCEKCYGEEGDIAKYMVDKGTTPGTQYYVYQLATFNTDDPQKNVEYYRTTVKALKDGDTSRMNSDQKACYEAEKKYLEDSPRDESLWGGDRWSGPQGAMGIVDYYIQNKLLLGDKFITSRTQTMSEKLATLDKMQAETITKIIMGASPAEDFDQFVENWKSLGGDQITREVNDWYAKNKK